MLGVRRQWILKPHFEKAGKKAKQTPNRSVITTDAGIEWLSIVVNSQR